MSNTDESVSNSNGLSVDDPAVVHVAHKWGIPRHDAKLMLEKRSDVSVP